MPAPIPEHVIEPGIRYLIVPKHRNGTPGASQWTVGVNIELDIYVTTRMNGWLNVLDGWGLLLERGTAIYLGLAEDHATNVFIAKFVGSEVGADQVWHGFPVLNNHDDGRPTAQVAFDWQHRGLLRAATVRKLIQGKPCAL